MTETPPTRSPLRRKLHDVIFEADTPSGKAFDVLLLIAILASIVAVCLESVESIRESHGVLLRKIEWGLTIAFSLEYLFRLYAVQRPLRYARSFYGIVDLLAIIPTYLSLIVAGSQSLIVIRALRLLRVFRVFKLAQFVGEANILMAAMIHSRRKILVFLGFIITFVFILGTLMYLVEGEASGFTSIPESVYWAIVTMTTVGYGDIAPTTVLGKFIASIVMISGYSVIAVPTGIVGAEIYRTAAQDAVDTHACPACGVGGHRSDARYCRRCAADLHRD